MSTKENQIKEIRLSRALKKNMKRRKSVRKNSETDDNPKANTDDSSYS
jgi:hypothetical protein